MSENEVKIREYFIEEAKKYAERVVREFGLFEAHGRGEKLNPDAFGKTFSDIIQVSLVLHFANEAIKRSRLSNPYGPNPYYDVQSLYKPQSDWLYGSTREEPEALPVLVDYYLKAVEKIRAKTKADLKEIEELRSETRAMISQMLAA